MTEPPLLEIRNLGVDFATPQGPVRGVAGVSLDVAQGECLAIVGESGCGKTQLFMACLGLLAANATAHGSARFAGRELIGMAETELNAIRGVGIGLVTQDPMNALTPHLRIERQLTEGLVDRGLLTAAEARQRALEALRAVDIDEAESRLRQYPHELSGGMRQRVALAMALAMRPRLLVADEPTTALDVTVQAKVLELLHRFRRSGLAVAIITHDLGVVAGLADRVAVMYAGRVVEADTAERIFCGPAHPYTAALLAAVPRLSDPAERPLANIEGSPPRPGELPGGCPFAPRCASSTELCRTREPPLVGGFGAAQVACHYPLPSGLAP